MTAQRVITRRNALWFVLTVLLVGTLIGDRAFAYWSVVLHGLPIYVTDTALLLALGLITTDAALRRDLVGGLPSFRGLLPFLVWGTILFIFSAPRYGVDAARDYAIFYYVLFVIPGYVAARSESFSAWVAVVYSVCSVIITLKAFFWGAGQKIGYGLTRSLSGQASMYLVVGVILALGLLPLLRRFRWVAAIFVVSALAAIALGQTRAAWLALLAGAGFIALTHPSWRKMSRVFLPVVALLLVSTISVFLVLGIWGPSRTLHSTLNRVSTGVLNPTFDDTAKFRLDAWSEVLKRAQARPLTGDGLGSPFEFRYYSWVVRVPPHNTYLTVLLKSGLVGVALLALALVWTYSIAIRALFARTHDLRSQIFLVGLLGAHASLSIYGLFFLLLESPYLAWPYWAVTGAILSISNSVVGPVAVDPSSKLQIRTAV